jgi:hypothetical protein
MKRRKFYETSSGLVALGGPYRQHKLAAWSNHKLASNRL